MTQTHPECTEENLELKRTLSTLQLPQQGIVGEGSLPKPSASPQAKPELAKEGSGSTRAGKDQKHRIFDSDDEGTKPQSAGTPDKEQLAELTAQLNTANSRVDALTAELAGKEQELEELKALLDRTTSQVQQLQDVIACLLLRNRWRLLASTASSKKRETTD